MHQQLATDATDHQEAIAPQHPQPRPSLADTGRELLANRVSGVPAWILLIQLFIGLGWLRAVAEKAIDLDWWSGESIRVFAAEHSDVTLGWYQPFVDSFVVPAAPVIGLIVFLCQLYAGLSLVSGRNLSSGLAVGIMLNLHFLAAGAVDPSAFYLLAQGAVGLSMMEQSRRADGALMARERLAAAGLFLAAISVPFISTLHPAEVIHDPAVMFVFGGALTAAVSLATFGASSLQRACLEKENQTRFNHKDW